LTDAGPAEPPPAPADDPIAALLALANEHGQQGRLDEAEAILDRILSGAPETPSAVHQKGIVAFRRGRTADAAALM
jgi:Flp pilus assembly protein TadD